MIALGHPTIYSGVQFRSRAEARWAAFFDLLGWPWSYELLELPGYIPDFVVRVGKRSAIVEVKGGVASLEGLEVAKPKVEAAQPPHDLLLVGAEPFWSLPAEDGGVRIGWLWESTAGFSASDLLGSGDAAQGRWSAGLELGRCLHCRALSVACAIALSDGGCFACGKNRKGWPLFEGTDVKALRGLWKRAVNATQWRSPARAA